MMTCHKTRVGWLSLTSEQPRGQVPGRVDSVATVEAETDSNAENSEANEERDQLFGHLHVAPVRDGTDTDE
jgi:hypothetical protein